MDLPASLPFETQAESLTRLEVPSSGEVLGTVYVAGSGCLDTLPEPENIDTQVVLDLNTEALHTPAEAPSPSLSSLVEQTDFGNCLSSDSDQSPYHLETVDEYLASRSQILNDPTATDIPLSMLPDNASSPGDPLVDYDSLLSSFFTGDDLALVKHTTACGPLYRSLSLESDDLVQHYFGHTSHLYSTFNSSLSPFVAFVSDEWQSSAPIHHAIQSAAAACLSGRIPRMRRVAALNESQALEIIRRDDVGSKTRATATSLMVRLIIGLSGSWHDQKAVGLEHLRAVQNAVYQQRLTDDNFADIYDFFYKALVYWEMVASAVDASVFDHACSSQREVFRKQLRKPQKSTFLSHRVAPHPWTGLACVPQMIMGQLLNKIHLVRFAKRKMSMCQADLVRLSEIAAETISLEAELWAFQLPNPIEVDDMGDPETPAIHHIWTAEAFILACLYQTYLVFPDIFQKRLDTLRLQTSSSGYSSVFEEQRAALVLSGLVNGFG
ncbi:hypothetical protein ACHAPJ_011828 [Fusarium lateritium]